VGGARPPFDAGITGPSPHLQPIREPQRLP
jgi:hypothetical protein